MKLSLNLTRWESALTATGATRSEWQFALGRRLAAPEWVVLLGSTGIDIAIDDVVVDARGLLSYQGQRVLIYIKDTRQTEFTLLNERENSKRFHFRECRKILEMKQINRFARYVAIARDDGLFPVFSTEIDGTSRELEAPLGPCKYCLREHNYEDYASQTVGNKKRIWSAFAVAKFFEQFSSQIDTMPPDQSSRAKPDTYGPGWTVLSREIRRRRGWICEQCGVNLEQHQALLHVHHANGRRDDNRNANLKVLCEVCHCEQPLHRGMHVAQAARATIMRLRQEQRTTR